MAGDRDVSLVDLAGPPRPQAPSREAVLLEQLVVAVARLGELVAPPPAPEVHVAAPDLSEIVTAVNALKPNVGADEIAEAVARVLGPPTPPAAPDTALAEVLAGLKKALETLDFRMKGPAYGASGPSNIASDPARQLGVVSVSSAPVPAQLDDIKRGLTDYDTRFDYGTRTDSNPTRIGKAPAGSAAADPVWTVQTFAYDGSSRPTLISVASGVAF